MKTSIQNNNYDTMLEPSDWRFSASINGLIQYMDYHQLEYEINDDYILYNSKDITEEKYLEFIEDKYGEEFHHKMVENILLNEEFNDDQVRLVNEKLSANTIMKKKFNKIKFNVTNKQEILNIINENRSELIKETFRRKSNMYINYANENQMFNEAQDYCRLQGYCIDVGKKGKSTGFNFVTSSFLGQDILEFDFLPFGFVGDREAFFINDNYTVQRLKITNDMFSVKIANDLDNEDKSKDARYTLFKSIIETSDFINMDVEVILKDKEHGYFETLYLRKESINILKRFNEEGIEYKSLCTSHKVTEKYYINIQKVVTESIMNNVLLDNLIEVLLKAKKAFLVSQLIKINVLIRGDERMKDKLKGAFACAKQVSKAIEDNKIDSYKQKLTSSIIFKDYDRVCQILLQLSNYSDIEFRFVYDLYDNFEDNKDLAYTFINALSKKTNNTESNNSENN